MLLIQEDGSKVKTKISLILLALASGSIYAAHMQDSSMPASNDIHVTAPEQPASWSFGATAALMKPTNQAFTYVDIAPAETSNNLNGVTQADNFQDVNQGYHWWFGADITYAFPGNGRDVTLAYEALRGDNTNNVTANNNTLYPVAYSLYFPYYDVNVDTAKGESKTSYDAGDLVFGQKLNVGERIALHPFIGLRYAHIDMKNTGTYHSTYYSGTEELIVQDIWESTFSGIGPRLGSDAQINLGQGFSVRARLGLSALIGSSSSKYENDDAFITAKLNYRFPMTHDSNTQLVPEMDGRLGLNYTYHFSANMDLGVEAGWQVEEYIDGVSMVGPPQDRSPYLPTNPSNTDITDSARINSNFGLQGPYARLQLDIA
jgi:hypothetical protein